MKFTVQRDTLAPALAALSRVVERRNTIPVLSNILVRAAGGTLTLQATDLDIQAQTSLACESEAEGAITLPAHTLTDIVRKLPSGAAITLESAAAVGDTRMTLKSGRSRFQLGTLPESDFPDIAAGAFSHSFTLPAKALSELISGTEFAINNEETRFYLNGIFLHVTDVEGAPLLRAVATDGHRLARYQLPAPEGAAGMPGVIVPRKTVGELARMAKEHDGDLGIELSQTKIRVTAGAATLTSKLIDGTYPDYQRILPTGNDKLATLDAEPLRQAVDRVSTISSERSRAVKVSLADGTLSLSVSNPDSGAASDEIEADYDGPPIEIGFQARYLLDILGVLGGDTVQIKLHEPGAPAILQRREGDSLLVVLMPMRV